MIDAVSLNHHATILMERVKARSEIPVFWRCLSSPPNRPWIEEWNSLCRCVSSHIVKETMIINCVLWVGYADNCWSELRWCRCDVGDSVQLHARWFRGNTPCYFASYSPGTHPGAIFPKKASGNLCHTSTRQTLDVMQSDVTYSKFIFSCQKLLDPTGWSGLLLLPTFLVASSLISLMRRLWLE